MLPVAKFLFIMRNVTTPIHPVSVERTSLETEQYCIGKENQNEIVFCCFYTNQSHQLGIVHQYFVSQEKPMYSMPVDVDLVFFLKFLTLRQSSSTLTLLTVHYWSPRVRMEVLFYQNTVAQWDRIEFASNLPSLCRIVLRISPLSRSCSKSTTPMG